MYPEIFHINLIVCILLLDLETGHIISINLNQPPPPPISPIVWEEKVKEWQMNYLVLWYQLSHWEAPWNYMTKSKKFLRRNLE